ncbi:hypothetical protein FHS87_004617 [Roseomonas pecuniae]|uniref:Uncharacterized protein n=1 Tax=Muricoccus pecuniae TaxID=693023 RepID=A0A840Y8R3_9PROT|nr:hypothetical protein [Roseomonas pecuniae]
MLKRVAPLGSSVWAVRFGSAHRGVETTEVGAKLPTLILIEPYRDTRDDCGEIPSSALQARQWAIIVRERLLEGQFLPGIDPRCRICLSMKL